MSIRKAEIQLPGSGIECYITLYDTEFSQVISLSARNDHVDTIVVQYPLPESQPTFLQGCDYVLAHLIEALPSIISKQIFIYKTEQIIVDRQYEAQFINEVVEMLE